MESRRGSKLIDTAVNLVWGIISGMRNSRVNVPNRCYHLISRVAHRAFFLDDEERTRLVTSSAATITARRRISVR